MERSSHYSTDLPGVISRRRRAALGAFLTVVLIGILITELTPPTYQTSAKILLKKSRAEVLISPGDTPGTVDTRTSTLEELNSQIQIVNSRTLLGEVVRQLALDRKSKISGAGNGRNFLADLTASLKSILVAIKEKLFSAYDNRLSDFDKALFKLEEGLSVVNLPESDIIKISYRGDDPRLTAGVVNALTDLYLDRHSKIYQSSESHKFFSDQTDLLAERLGESEENLKRYRQEQEIVSLESQKEKNLEKMVNFRADLKNTQIQINELKQEIVSLEAQLKREPARIITESKPVRNEVLDTLRTKLAELEIIKRGLLTKYMDGSVKVKEVQEQIAEIRTMLAKEEKIKAQQEETSNLNPAHQSILLRLNTAKAQLDSLRAKETSTASQIEYYDNMLKDLDAKNFRLVQLERVFKKNEEAYLLYQKKQEEARIADAMDKSRILNISVIEPAAVTLTPIAPKRSLNYILSLILGALAGIGMAFIAEYMDHSVYSALDISLPVLAEIPERNRRMLLLSKSDY